MMIYTICIKLFILEGVTQKINHFWRDTLCQNNLKINFSPESSSTSLQAPPVFDFIHNTMIQVYTGIAAEQNDTNLSFSTLVNGFGNISIHTYTPIFIYRFKLKNIVYYNDFFAQATGTIPDQTQSMESTMLTTGIGLNSSFILKGDQNRLSFFVRHKFGLSYGDFPGLMLNPNKKILVYQSMHFQMNTPSGSVFFEVPLMVSRINIGPSVVLGYYRNLSPFKKTPKV